MVLHPEAIGLALILIAYLPLKSPPGHHRKAAQVKLKFYPDRQYSPPKAQDKHRAERPA